VTEHQGLPVLGYQPQPQASVDAVNALKQLEEQILRSVDALKADPYPDKRWVAIGETHIQQAFMALNRSIFQPQRIK